MAPTATCAPGFRSGKGGDLNWSTQHFTFEMEVECDGTTTEAAFLYGNGECRDLGRMAQRRRSQVDRPCLRQDLVSIFAHLCPTGGIRPPPRRRSRLALTLAEREEISRGVAHGQSLRRIARSLERAPSTVSREIARNGGSGPYRAAASDRQAWCRARRPKACKLARHAPAASRGHAAQTQLVAAADRRVAEEQPSRG